MTMSMSMMESNDSMQLGKQFYGELNSVMERNTVPDDETIEKEEKCVSWEKITNFSNLLVSTLNEIHQKVIEAKVELVDTQNTKGVGYNHIEEKNRAVHRCEGQEMMLKDIIEGFNTLVMS